MMLLPHQARLIIERDDLAEKLQKLTIFFDTESFKNIDSAEQKRLIRQASFMRGYLKILNERIQAFGG